jgi:ribosomal protein S18 acetylase RimI-like enzyme
VTEVPSGGPRLPGAPAVRPMTGADVEAVVQVHLRGFPSFFLTELGPRFVHELYRATLADPDGFGVVAQDGQTISGFATGTAQPAGFYRRLLCRRWWRFALASAVPVMRRPRIAPRLVRALAMPGRVTRQPGRGTLMSIAVVPEGRGQGIGGALVRAFIDEAGRRGVRQVDLTTDQQDNQTGNRFYGSLGFVRERTFTTPEGRVMNEYVIDVPTPQRVGR